ncbi:MAG: SLC13 family permease [bacterium JZ-2024 1]
MEQRWEILRRKISFLLGPVLFVVFLLLPMKGLTAQGHRLSAILSLVVVYWVGEALPIPVTALLGVILCVIMGVGGAKEVFAPFADPIIFLFLGSFILARAMQVHRLERRLAFLLLSLPGVSRSAHRILFTFGAFCAFLSMWMSNTATTAMMLPIALGIIHSSPEPRNEEEKKKASHFATSMMLMLAFSASVGGIGTPVGTPPNLIGIGMIEKLLNIRITFFTWMEIALPLLVAMFLFLFFLMVLLHPFSPVMMDTSEWLKKQQEKLGRWSRGEINCLVAFSVAVFLWVFPGFLSIIYGTESAVYQGYNRLFPEGVVALLAAGLLFILPLDWKKSEFTLTWKEAIQIDWGTLLLFGGGLSLGNLMFQTGLAEKIGKVLLSLTGTQSVWTITAFAAFFGVLISETTSNTASANMVVPVVIALAKAAGVSAVPPALAGTLGASFGFILPVSTPPNAIVYGSGLIPLHKMMRAGIVFDFIGFLIIFFGLRLLAPLFGWV